MKIALIAIAFLMSGVFSQTLVNGGQPYAERTPFGLSGTNPQGDANPNAFGLGNGNFFFQDGLYRVDGSDPFIGGQQFSQIAQTFGASARNNEVFP